VGLRLFGWVEVERKREKGAGGVHGLRVERPVCVGKGMDEVRPRLRELIVHCP
jgi:hypothetical protein